MGNKIDQNKDLMVEINISEAPMFSFTKNSKTESVKKMMENNTTTEAAKDILKDIYITNQEAKVGYRRWNDSKGIIRELIISSERSLPDSYCMDVFIGLVRLMIKYNSPMHLNEEGNYKFKSNKVEFTLNELCRAMEVKAGGRTYEKIKDSLRRLKSANYYSVGHGSIYDKTKASYETSSERLISLIDSYSTSEIIKTDEDSSTTFKAYVVFGDLIMRNLIAGFVRVIRNHQYFELKTGITRGLYLYIESNRTSKERYIKRSFDVLKNKIPIDFKYPSCLKIKLEKSLNDMKKLGIISDYFYADEFLVNGVKEPCIYIIFKGNKHTLINELEQKHKFKNTDKVEDIESKVDKAYKKLTLKFPENIKEELEAFNINELKITKIINTNSKYEIAKYILWIKDGISKGKVKDPAALFVFAMTNAGAGQGKMVKVETSNPEIVNFIDHYKREVEGKKDISENIIRKAFNKYIESEVDRFKDDDEFAYIATKEAVIDDIELVKDKKIKTQRQLYNMATTKEDKEKILLMIDKWERFSVEKEKSEIFIEILIKRISSYRGIEMYEDFKRRYIDENS